MKIKRKIAKIIFMLAPIFGIVNPSYAQTSNIGELPTQSVETNPPTLNFFNSLPYEMAYISYIMDGDSFIADLAASGKTHIRLAGIDAPEICPTKEKGKCLPQAFGVAARNFIRSNCTGTALVRVLPIEYDPRYKRYTSIVSCNGVDLASALVHNGLAHIYEPYTSKYRKDLYMMVADAKIRAVGVYGIFQKHPSMCRKDKTLCYEPNKQRNKDDN